MLTETILLLVLGNQALAAAALPWIKWQSIISDSLATPASAARSEPANRDAPLAAATAPRSGRQLAREVPAARAA